MRLLLLAGMVLYGELLLPQHGRDEPVRISPAPRPLQLTAAGQPGRTAIDRALAVMYHDPKSLLARFGPAEVSPLEEIRVYAHPDGHWHYVTLGVSELGAKVSEDRERSGWGYELTLRLISAGGQSKPAQWPVRALRQLAEYVYREKNPFQENHHMDLGGPVDEEAPAIRAFAFTRDPGLGTIETPNGKLTFLQVVGLRADENELVARWSVKSFIEVLAQRAPLLATRADRASLLDDRELGPLLRRRANEEDPPPSVNIVSELYWRRSGLLRKKIEIRMGPAKLRKNLRRVLQDKRFNRFRVAGQGRDLWFEAGQRAAWSAHEQALTVTLSPALREELAEFLGGTASSFDSRELRGLSLHLVDE